MYLLTGDLPTGVKPVGKTDVAGIVEQLKQRRPVGEQTRLGAGSAPCWTTCAARRRRPSSS